MERYFYRIPDWIGEFRSVAAPQWEEYQDGVRRATFVEQTRTADWITLFDASRDMHLILPVPGGQSHFMIGGGPNWTALYAVDRIQAQFTPQQNSALNADLQSARAILDKVLARLTASAIFPTASVQDMRQKVRNVFHINVMDPMAPDFLTEMFAFTNLVANFKTLRTVGFDQQFPFHFEADYTKDLVAWVVGTSDPLVHIAPAYFYQDAGQGIYTLIHERAHTVLQLQGHPPDGTIHVGIDPALGVPTMAASDAIRNPYCYEWLAKALQRG